MAPRRKPPTPESSAFGTATATRVLATLPPLDAKRRELYRGVFTDEQCHAWGRRTKARVVVQEANRLIGSLGALFARREVVGYARHRLAWLCELTLALASAVHATADEEAKSALTRTTAPQEAADRLLTRIVDGLLSAAEGNDVVLKQLSALKVRRDSNARLMASLRGVTTLAARLRSTEDGRVLCDDVGLSAAVLKEVDPLLEQLSTRSLAAAQRPKGSDTPETNQLEGRVLRELAFATSALRRAKALDATVPALPFSKVLGRLMHHGPAAGKKARARPAKPTRGVPPG